MARTFFILYHADDVASEKVTDVKEQLQQAINGEEDIVVVPEDIAIEQISLESVEAWES